MDTAELVKKLRYLKGISKVIPEAADTIERLQKENDRLRRPRCLHEPAGDPCKFCGAREATDVCRDGTDHIIRERDAALAEVERLKRENERLDGTLEGFMARQGEQMA